jgi:opacity protein-like surface antigen
MRFVTAATVALLAMAGSAAMAQQSDLPTRAGDKAIYFSIDGLGEFNVGQVNVDNTFVGVSGIEGKYFFRDNMAWRLGLGFGRNETTDAQGNDVTTTRFAIAPGFEYHFVTAQRFSLYTGGVISYAVFDRETDVAGGSVVDNDQGFGLAALLGAEFYPWQNVSLGAEYRAGFETGSNDTTNWAIGSGGQVKLGFHF